MPRKKWPVQLVIDVYNKYNNPYGIGSCWHCGKKIIFKQRTKKDGRYPWHIDHYPVPFRDIENQILFGVTNQHDIKNLVPSCVACNLSHEHEITHWYYCNSTQIYCKRKCLKNIFIYCCFLILIIYSITVSILLIYFFINKCKK